MSRRVVTPENLSTDFLVDDEADTPVSLNLDEALFSRDPTTGLIGFAGATDYLSFVSGEEALSTTPNVLFAADVAAVWDLTVSLDDGSGLTKATIIGHTTTPTVNSQISVGTAITLSVSGTNIRAALASGAAAAHFTAVRII